MSVDISRIRSNPLLDFAGVELKQGGVLLDADFNELIAVVDRRLRSLASDTLGRSTVSATTPDAFKLSIVNEQLVIAKGRMYVDGLLAENHGLASDVEQKQFDGLLGEPTFSDVIPYDAQPYLPDAPATPKTGRRLVYLDVWEREVTHIERPALIESAVGVETSSRKQIVWQVRVSEEDIGQADCSTPDADINGWPSRIAPSRGRLTTGSYDVSADANPCELPPGGGYTGLENQTYRVEIHDGGEAGGSATFKWSRENASVVSAVTSLISASKLEVSSLGRDEFLRIRMNDWVEITDDVRELSQRAGDIRRIIEVNEATRSIGLSAPLAGDLLPTAFPAPSTRSLRVKRWDQAGRVVQSGESGTTTLFVDVDDAANAGRIPVPTLGTTLLLENGVTVSFGSTAGADGAAFRAGDFWVFAARTTDASVEFLENEPPRGIHHHFARLGIWNVQAASVADCRTLWPPSGADGHDCSCSVCVTAESHASGAFTIQQAVDQVHDTGGTICLGAGSFLLRSAVELRDLRAVRIRGQGSATVITGGKNGAFHINRTADVTVEHLTIRSVGSTSAIRIHTALGLHLNRLTVVALHRRDPTTAAIALSGVVLGARICDNAFFAPIGVKAADEVAGPQSAVPSASRMLLAGNLRIEDNAFWCEERGVSLVGPVMHVLATSVCGNDIRRSRQVAVAVLGAGTDGASMDISRNTVNVRGAGIVASVDGLTIQDNVLASSAGNDVEAQDTGIAVRVGLKATGVDRCAIRTNTISGFSGVAVSVGLPVRDLQVNGNVIEQCGNGIVLGAKGSENVSIVGNHVRDIGHSVSDDKIGVCGIRVAGATAVVVQKNVIRRIGRSTKLANSFAGVMLVSVDHVQISSNDICEIGPERSPREPVGVYIVGHGSSDVAGNCIRQDSNLMPSPNEEPWTALRIDGVMERRPVAFPGSYAIVRLDDRRSLTLGGSRPFFVTAENSTRVDDIVVASGSGAIIRGNSMSSRGASPVVHIRFSGDCIFSDNRCDSRGNPRGAAVRLECATGIVSSNRVGGGKPSIELTSDPASVTVLGNITSNGITPLGAPWVALNVVA